MPAHRVPEGHRVDNRAARSLVVLPDGAVDDPEATATWPAPPDGLLAVTVAVWDRFWRSRIRRAVQNEIEVERLERWAYTLDEWYRLSRAIRRRRVVASPQGPKLNPLVAYLRQIEGELYRIENSFGMSPLARARMGLTVAEGKRTAAELNRLLEGRPRDRDPGTAGSAEPATGQPDDSWSAGFEAG